MNSHRARARRPHPAAPDQARRICRCGRPMVPVDRPRTATTTYTKACPVLAEHWATQGDQPPHGHQWVAASDTTNDQCCTTTEVGTVPTVVHFGPGAAAGRAVAIARVARDEHRESLHATFPGQFATARAALLLANVADLDEIEIVTRTKGSARRACANVEALVHSIPRVAAEIVTDPWWAVLRRGGERTQVTLRWAREQPDRGEETGHSGSWAKPPTATPRPATAAPDQARRCGCGRRHRSYAEAAQCMFPARFVVGPGGPAAAVACGHVALFPDPTTAHVALHNAGPLACGRDCQTTHRVVELPQCPTDWPTT